MHEIPTSGDKGQVAYTPWWSRYAWVALRKGARAGEFAQGHQLILATMKGWDTKEQLQRRDQLRVDYNTMHAHSKDGPKWRAQARERVGREVRWVNNKQAYGNLFKSLK